MLGDRAGRGGSNRKSRLAIERGEDTYIIFQSTTSLPPASDPAIWAYENVLSGDILESNQRAAAIDLRVA